MSNLKNPEDALTHPALNSQAHRMVDLYIGGLRVETIFAQCDVPYTTHTRKLFDQARRALGHSKRKKIGAVNPAWNGGEPRYRNGYRYIPIPGTFDKNGRTCYRKEHHVVMEHKLGRPLLKMEVVHHIDGNILNNSIENLELFASNGAHLAKTRSGMCPKWSEAGRQAIDRAIASMPQVRRARGEIPPL